MTRYRKKPVEVDAWKVGSDEPMPEWADALEKVIEGPADFFLLGWGSVSIGDWLVNGYDDIYIVDTNTFEQTYEVVE